MDEDRKPVRGKALAVTALVSGIAAFAWLFYFADALVLDYVKGKWPEWYGMKWFQASHWHTFPIFGTVTFGPMIILIALAVLLFRRFYYLNFATLHEANLRELTKAKFALRQGLESVEAIEREYKGKLQSFEQLRVQLEELQSVKKMDTEGLRKTLNAVALASRRSVWFERFLGFATGVASSLLATYIWERLR